MEMTTILYAGLGFAFVLLIVGLVVSIRDERSLVEERLGRYLEERGEARGGIFEGPTQMTDWLNAQAGRFAWGKNLSKELARADIKLRAGEYLGVLLFAALSVGGIAWYFGGRTLLSAAIGIVVGMYLPRVYVRREQHRRLIRFDEQLADMLNLMVNGLRAGYSTMQALEAVSRELPPPISDEFRRVVQEMQLGIPMERALDNLFRRIPSNDLDLIITAMNVQREVGGNLSEILDTISHTIRERVRIKGEIRVLVAQQMISGKFLSSMPLLLTGGLYFLNREYIMNFVNPETRWLGIPLLILAGFLIVLGYFAMKKIADIEV